MRQLNHKEKNRILELHNKTPMKPWEYKLLTEQNDLYSSIKTKQQGDAFRDWVHNNYPNIAKLYNLSKSSDPNSIYYYSNSMNNAWGYYDPIKKGTLGDLFLKSSSYKSSTNNFPGRNVDSPGEEWEFDNVSPAKSPYQYQWSNPSATQNTSQIRDVIRPNLAQSFNEKEYYGKTRGDIRDFKWFEINKLREFVWENFPNLTNEFNLKDMSIIWDDNFVNWIKSQNSQWRGVGNKMNVGQEWRTYAAKTLNDWKKELQLNGYTPPSRIDTDIEKIKNQVMIHEPGQAHLYKQKPIEELTYEEKMQAVHFKLLILQMASFMIPYVGIPLSGIIGIADAKLYEQDGNEEEAALSYLLAILPFTSYASKIPRVAKFLSNNTLRENIGSKILNFNKGTVTLTKDELLFMKDISEGLKNGKLTQDLNGVAKTWADDILASKNIDVLNDAKRLNRLKMISNIGLEVGYFISDWESQFADPLSDVIYGKSVRDIVKYRHGKKSEEEIDALVKQYKDEFQWGSSSDDEKMIMALNDPTATDCRFWDLNRPVPGKYQTDTYKRKLNDIIKALDLIGIKTDNDCRYPGTFGRELTIGDKDYIFKDGQYLSRVHLGGETEGFVKGYKVKIPNKGEWYYITDPQKIKTIESQFINKGLIKDQKGLYYVDKK